MPSIKISTQVESSVQNVKEGFNRLLFEKLAPPFPKTNILRFDGCKTGDQVWLELDFGVFRQNWHALITEDSEDDSSWFFIDQGSKLPFPLKTWKHKHLVYSAGEGAVIVDDIQFTTSNGLLDLLSYPAFYLMFALRKPIYRKVFHK
jgi:ligand-binding SRPBCC domain-containing protein